MALNYGLQGQGLINQSGFAGQTAFAQPGLVQQGYVQQGLVGAQAGLIGQPGLVGQQFAGQQSLLGGGVPGAVGISGVQQPLGGGYGNIGTTNQFVPGYGYNQGCSNYCPWWIWLILAALLLGGLIAGLITAFSGNNEKRTRRHRSKTTVSEQAKTSAGNDADASSDNADSSNEASSSKTTTTTTTKTAEGASAEGASAEGSAEAKAENHHLRYSVSEWM